MGGMKFIIVVLHTLILLQSSFACFLEEAKLKALRSGDSCHGGTRQSPISIVSCNRDVTLKPLNFSGHGDLRPLGFTLKNVGETVQVRYTGVAPTLRGGPLSDEYTFSQLHFHWGEEDELGSEHRLLEHFSSFEMHLVHFKTEYGSLLDALDYPDGLAVVGLLFKLHTCNNPEMSAILSGLEAVRYSGNTTALPGGAMSWLSKYLHPENSCGYVTYQGSLTGTPCTEVVTWIVLQRQSTVGHLQLEQFRGLLDDHNHPLLENRRELQPLNQREILCAH